MNLEDTLQASFKGIPFPVTRSSVEGGRRDVRKAFANSSRTLHEFMGKDTRRYRLIAVINTTYGANGEPTRRYLDFRADLLAALESRRPGTLIHPIEGRLANMVAVPPFNLRESFERLGAGQISITFEESTTDGQPAPVPNRIGGVVAQNDVVLDEIEADVSENFEVTNTFAGNFGDAVTSVESIVIDIEAATSITAPLTAKIDAFAARLGQLSDNVTSLIAEPVALSTSLRNVFMSMNGLHATVSGTFVAFTQLFDYGAGASRFPSDTAARIERQKNRDILTTQVQGAALGYAYQNAAQKDYTTVEEIETVQAVLEEQYQKVAAAPSTTLEVLEELSDLRTVTESLLDAEKLTARRVTEITVSASAPVPTRVLAYRYYGSSELGNAIAELNELQNLTFASGTLEIFTP